MQLQSDDKFYRSDDKLYRAVLNLQANEDFAVVKAYLAQRHMEEAGRFQVIMDEAKLRQSQGKAAILIELLQKMDPQFSRIELDRMEANSREAKATRQAL